MGWGIVYPPYSILNMGGNPPPQTRWVYNFNGVDSYIDSGEITLSGDFSVECDIQTTQATDFAICDGSKFTSLPTYALIYVDNPDGLQFVIKNQVLGFDRHIFGGRSEIINGQVNNIKLSRVGAYLTAYVNSVQIGSSTYMGTGDVTLEGLWFGGQSRYMTGKGYNVKINNGSVYNYPINDRTFGVGAPIANSATVLGGELVPNGKFDTDVDGWENTLIRSWENGRLKLNPTKSYQSSGRNITVEPNTPYLFKCNVETLGTGTAQGYIQVRDVVSNTVLHQKIGTAYSEVLIVPTGTELRINLHGNEVPAVTYFDNISLKKADGYATGVNLLESGWEEIPL